MKGIQFNAQKVLSALLAGLSDRSQDVILSRFGINKDNYETLEAIGQRYGITRERVRQIEADAIKQIKGANNESLLGPLLMSLDGFIKSKGGVVDEISLKEKFAENHFSDANSGNYKGMVGLLLSVGKQFKKSSANDNFSARWFTSEGDLKSQEKVCAQIVSQLKNKGDVADGSKVVAMVVSADSNFKKDVVLNYLVSSQNIKQNVFGQWGLAHWAEVNPRGVRDKAYLVMREKKNPLHFREVAELINDNNFSSRKALAQTVHNELIRDERFILVGRGLYALREWGYSEGTVKDVIARLLKKKGAMHKDDLVQAVLAERFVKPSTIVLNLNSFKRDSDNKYTLV